MRYNTVLWKEYKVTQMMATLSDLHRLTEYTLYLRTTFSVYKASIVMTFQDTLGRMLTLLGILYLINIEAVRE